MSGERKAAEELDAARKAARAWCADKALSAAAGEGRMLPDDSPELRDASPGTAGVYLRYRAVLVERAVMAYEAGGRRPEVEPWWPLSAALRVEVVDAPTAEAPELWRTCRCGLRFGATRTAGACPSCRVATLTAAVVLAAQDLGERSYGEHGPELVAGLERRCAEVARALRAAVGLA